MRDVLRPKPRQRGGALIVVLIVLVLMAALALEVAATASTHARLAEHGMNEYLLQTAAEGRREILRSAIRFSKRSNQNVTREDMDCFWHNHDTLGKWSDTGDASTPATGSGDDEGATVYSNTEMTLMAWCEDERSKICLLGLVPKGNDEGTSLHDRTRRFLIRLIDVYREPWSDLDLTESDAEEMVDALVEYLHTTSEDDDEVPIPDTPQTIGRLRSLDDLQHVEGWTPERLYDVKDPDADEEDEPLRRSDLEDEETEEGREDASFFKPNGVPGLYRFLTVHAQGGDTPEIRINFNTAPHTVLRALFDAQTEHLAEAIIEHRRQGVDTEDDGAQPAEGQESGYFTGPADLAKVEGIEDNWQTEYPGLAMVFDVNSNIFSMHAIASVVEREEEHTDDDDVIPPIVSSFYLHEIVEWQATGGNAGNGGSVVTRFVERRRPDFIEGR